MQSAQRAHLLRHWEAGPSPFSQHTGLCAALRATAFVPVGAERRLCTPAEVLDPYPSPYPYPYPYPNPDPNPDPNPIKSYP